MHRNWIILLIYTFIGLNTNAQNNPIYSGGSGGNSSSLTYNQVSDTSMFKGNDGDGNDMTIYEQLNNNILNHSGIGDSWNNTAYLPTNQNTSMYKSNTSDGWNISAYNQLIDTALFKSNSSDGWISVSFLQIADTVLFKGGLGDGWSDYYIISTADSSLFKGGIGDGWIAQIVEIPLIPLPIRLLRFVGEIQNEYDHLEWETSSEVNTSHFIIEHSTDGKKFFELGMVNASGYSTTNTTYRFNNKTPESGANFYRIKIVDIDGHAEFSNAILLYRADKKTSISLAPTPTADFINIQISGDVQNQISLEMYNESGLKVMKKSINDDTKELQVDLTKFASGPYFIIINAGQIVKTFKVIKVE